MAKVERTMIAWFLRLTAIQDTLRCMPLGLWYHDEHRMSITTADRPSSDTPSGKCFRFPLSLARWVAMRAWEGSLSLVREPSHLASRLVTGWESSGWPAPVVTAVCEPVYYRRHTR